MILITIQSTFVSCRDHKAELHRQWMCQKNALHLHLYHSEYCFRLLWSPWRLLPAPRKSSGISPQVPNYKGTNCIATTLERSRLKSASNHWLQSQKTYQMMLNSPWAPHNGRVWLVRNFKQKTWQQTLDRKNFVTLFEAGGWKKMWRHWIVAQSNLNNSKDNRKSEISFGS